MDRSIYGKLSAAPSQSRHTNIYIHIVLTHLKKHDRPLSFKEIERETGISVGKTAGLLTLLQKNKKVRRQGDTLLYVPTYSIHSEQDLLGLLRDTRAAYGIPLEEILDSNTDTKPFVLSLLKKREAFSLKDIDGSVVVFYNPAQIPKASDDVLKLYEGVAVPDLREMSRELTSAGLAGKAQEKPVRRAAASQRKKKYNRKIKITNTHIDTLDLGIP